MLRKLLIIALVATVCFANTQNVSEIIQQAGAAKDAKNFTLLLDLANQIIAKDAKSELGYGIKAIALSELNKTTEALEAMKQVETLAPNNYTILGDKPFILRKAGREVEAYQEMVKVHTLIDKAYVKNKTDVTVLAVKANVLVYLSKYDKKAKKFNVSLDYEPSNYQLLHQRCGKFIALDNTRDALKCIENTIKITPSLGSLYMTKALALQIADLNKNILKNKTDVDSLHQKAALLANFDFQQQTLNIYERVLKINPKDAFANNQKGTIMLKLTGHNFKLNKTQQEAEKKKALVFLKKAADFETDAAKKKGYEEDFKFFQDMPSNMLINL